MSKKHLQSCVHFASIHNRQEIEIIKFPSADELIKKNVVPIHSGYV
jgi:hypothetical protein